MHLWKRVEKIYWTYETDYQCITRNITRFDLIFRTPNEINVGLEIRPDPTRFYAESNITFSIFPNRPITRANNVRLISCCDPDFYHVLNPKKFVRHAKWPITRDITTKNRLSSGTRIRKILSNRELVRKFFSSKISRNPFFFEIPNLWTITMRLTEN